MKCIINYSIKTLDLSLLIKTKFSNPTISFKNNFNFNSLKGFIKDLLPIHFDKRTDWFKNSFSQL